MEVKVHGTEVDLQLGGVLLLLEQLHLSFSLLPGLLAFELLLSLSSLSLLLLVVLLLLIVKLLLLFLADGLGSAMISQVLEDLISQGLHLLWLSVGLRLFFAIESLDFVLSIGTFELKLVLGKIGVIIVLQQLMQFRGRILKLKSAKLFGHLSEHGVLKLDEEFKNSWAHLVDRRAEHNANVHQVSARAKGSVVPQLFVILLLAEAVFQSDGALFAIAEFFVDTDSEKAERNSQLHIWRAN